MASANSLRCLVGPAMAPRLQPMMLAAASFSTSAVLAAAAPPAIKSRRDLPAKQKKTYKKRANVTPVRKPNPGERKAFRKRIQLSNNSALPVEGLGALEAGNMALDENAGKVFSIPDHVVDQLRALEAFKTTQSWNLFRRPHVLLRKETVELMKKLEGSVEKKEALKCVLTGSKLSGKSMTMLQAMAYALLNNWVVFHVPEGQDLTNGNTEYSPIPDTEPMQFAQPVYCLKMIQNLYRANRAVLEKLQLQKDWSRFTNLKQGATLADLALSAKEAEYAWPTLLALWTELTLPGRPPILFALDGLAHINKISEYRDPSFNEVHAHELSLVRTFVDALSGKTPLPNGGAIIGVTSENNSHHHPSQELVLSQLEAGQAGQRVPRPNPYERKYDERVYEALKNSWVLRVDGVSKDEARSLMEYWGASGLVRNVLNSRTVSEKWTVGGHGIVGEMERATLLQMRM
ncbi:mitochondrial ribosomal death-associated protein 3-domain-containing protein [Ilyonectria robusta]|uniref:mitochondrial ribosomal death-associated protein 3-domain-containing protein n=1 Tax=Ilyonectria robusta TaxID=1079257 RepID=UPI001E8E0AFF|nr:mitochondrial ribosomal death-associated protein 3-domain-containing protein [Ilyonectria robusta]KAH8737553.1 mitochondrial ribosomal death-associated protein 3-domain-containing protein [Ilyonectria robusta]